MATLAPDTYVNPAFPPAASVAHRRGKAGAATAAERGPAELAAPRRLLIAALVLAPLAFGAVQAWAWSALTALVALAAFAWAWASARRGGIRLVWTPIYLPAAGFLAIALIQYGAHLTADPVATRESVLKLVTDLVVFGLAMHLWNGEPAAARRFAIVVSVFAGALALFAVLQSFASPDAIYGFVRPRWGGWIFGPYVNHNHYAGLMELLIPIAFGGLVSLRLAPRPSPGAVLAAFALMLAIASVLLSGSRGGLVCLLVEIVAGAALFWKYFPGATRRRWLGAGLLGLAAASALFLWLDPGRLWKRLGTVADLPRAPEATLGERRVVAGDAMRLFLRHPWLGTGLGSFATVYPQYRSFATDLEWDHAHNDYAEALAEAGIAGSLAIAAGLVMFLLLAFRDLRAKLVHGESWITLGAALGCCGLMVHGLADFNFHIPANAAWFSLCAGLAVSDVRARRARKEDR